MTESTIKKRVLSIDILRGIIMVIMALDHTRDFFSDYQFEPTDLHHAGTIMFFTRWITHFCAPVFVFLAGTSVFLSGKRKSKKELFFRLLSRGIWLIVLELTFVHLGWAFNFDYSHIFLQVIWALGVSMICLSVLIFLPRQLILGIGLIMIFGHNAFDGLHPAGSVGVFWDFLHVQGPITYGHGNSIFIMYPLIPWIGVMATGYCFGAVFVLHEKKRRDAQYLIGMSAMVLFVVIRAINLYGDPSPWLPQPTWWRTVLSFLNCTKYPPSLLYLLMTLGPSIALLPLLEKMSGKVARIFLVYGRVPLFYYVLHIFLIHGMAIIDGYFFKGNAVTTVFSHPGFSLPVVYCFWLLAVIILYFPCRWFMRIKMSRHDWWLSYL